MTCYFCDVRPDRMNLYRYAAGRFSVVIGCQSCGTRFKLDAITEEQAQQRAFAYSMEKEPHTPILWRQHA